MTWIKMLYNIVWNVTYDMSNVSFVTLARKFLIAPLKIWHMKWNVFKFAASCQVMSSDECANILRYSSAKICHKLWHILQNLSSNTSKYFASLLLKCRNIKNLTCQRIDAYSRFGDHWWSLCSIARQTFKKV